MKAIGLAAVWLLLLGLTAGAVPRVALMDFATDDNSYRSARAASDFSVILQASLTGATNVEWVERGQLDKARRELELSAVANMEGAAVARLGKWAKADWTVMGHFSMDDRNQRTLFLEITDLQHADVLASQTLIFSGAAAPPVLVNTQQVAEVAGSLQQLLAQAQVRQQQMAGRILVAPLFLAEVPGTNLSYGFFRNGMPFKDQDFLAALERTAATNQRVQIIHFPQAYRAIGESELVFDGLTEPDQNGWQQTADLYVWGTYSVQSRTIPKRPTTNTCEITLHLWDGISAPKLIKGELPVAAPRAQVVNLLETLAVQTLANARHHASPNDTGAVRTQIAQSLVDTYDQMTLRYHSREELGLHDQERFLQAVHMLETACFFDPDSARARALYITCRWGWWMDFRFNVKNEFWSIWRRSQACGAFVNRFGLEPVKTELPFPYNRRDGMAGLYTESLGDVLELFPHWSSLAEVVEETRQSATEGYGELRDAERNGFPKDMPPEVAWQWLQEVKAELARRQKRVKEFSLATAVATNAPAKPHRATPTRIQPVAGLRQVLPLASKMTNSSAKMSGMHRVSWPAWGIDLYKCRSMFQLSPPNVLPVTVTPVLTEFRFPAQYEVVSVLRLQRWQDKLFILAMDERSGQSSEENPGVTAELQMKYNRLWVLEPAAPAPVLFRPELFTQNVQDFLLRDDQLWIVGRITGCLDLAKNSFYSYGLKDGLPVPETAGIGCASGTLFLSDSAFNHCQLDQASNHWSELPKPKGSRRWSENIPLELMGNDRWLLRVQPRTGAYLYDLRSNDWRQLFGQDWIQCSAVAQNGFWLGSQEGLRFYDPALQTFKSWLAPKAVAGARQMSLPGGGNGIMIGTTVWSTEVEQLDQNVQDAMRDIRNLHAKVRLSRSEIAVPADPCHLNWRIPDAIQALYVDGDFLWVGTEGHLLLWHLPSESMVANYDLPAHDQLRSLLVDDTSVWIGTAYGNHKLLRLPKAAFTSVPPTSWLSLAIAPAERERLVKRMSQRDQAVYAFHAAEDEQVVQLLGGVDPKKATLEEMFLLLFSCEGAGADQPELVKTWAEHIKTRWPDSPWSKVAQQVVFENEKAHETRQHAKALLAKYDTDRNGKLDAKEQRVMEKDPEYQRAEPIWNRKLLGYQVQEIMKRYDEDGNGRLDGAELSRVCIQVAAFSQATPEMLANRKSKMVVAPMLAKQIPPVPVLLQRFDPTHSGGLDAEALRTMIQTLPNR